MGKINGFLLYKRTLPKKELVKNRIQHYREFQYLFSDKKLNEQSSRCMNCGVPFCQNGCPLGNIIPEFNDAVYNKQWKKAYDILLTTNQFPEFTGRICPAPCEGACVLGINETPVTIEEIEKHIIEIAFKKGFVFSNKKIQRTGKKVAIIGSGPSGLSAAIELNKLGHLITVYEKDSHPGGLLRFGIPDFKLEKKIVERRINLMKDEGINFKTNINVGKDIDIKELKQFDAVILAIGTRIPRDLILPGRDANGIYFAMEYLKQTNQKVSKIKFNNSTIDTKGKRVLIIGGGDTGSDCIGTANREGAIKIDQIEILPTPPKKRNKNNPWPSFPMILKTTSSHEEGCKRRWSINSKEFIKDNNNNIKGIRLVEIEWDKNSNSNNFIEKPNSEFILSCDLIFLSMGFIHVEKTGLIKKLNIELNANKNQIKTNINYQTNKKNIFCCGDARIGQSLVVWAINDGKKCSKTVNNFLNNN